MNRILVDFATFLFLLILVSCSQRPGNESIYNVLHYGAVNDSSALTTQAFQKAIDECSENGGGSVVVPAGIYLLGSIELKSNVNLHLSNGAKLAASDKLKDYDFIKVDYTSYGRDYGGHEVIDAHERFAFIIANQANNISITGSGIIDGNGGKGEDFKVTVDSSGAWHKPKRPRLVQFISCRDVLMRDVSLQYTQFWHLHLENCEDVHLDNLAIYGHANANDDGIDINSCRDVTIQNCKVDVGDDALVFKTKGCAPNKNILVQNCTFASETRCIQFGSETEGDMSNIMINNVLLKPTKERPEWPEEGAKPFSELVPRRLGAGISINTNDGGVIDGVTISNVLCQGLPSPVYLHTAQRQWLYSEGRRDSTMDPGTIKNVTISNFRAVGAKATANSTIMGMEGFPLENIKLDNIFIEYDSAYDTSVTQLDYLEDKTENAGWSGFWGKKVYYPASGFEFRYVDGLWVSGVVIVSKDDPRPEIIVEKSENINIKHHDRLFEDQDVDEEVEIY